MTDVVVVLVSSSAGAMASHSIAGGLVVVARHYLG
jgi:hypothetical protein